MTTLLEQVAKAIYETPDEGYAWGLNADNATQELYRLKASAAIEALRPDTAIRIEHLLYDVGDELEKQLNLKPGTIPLGTGTNIRRFVEAVLGTQSETDD